MGSTSTDDIINRIFTPENITALKEEFKQDQEPDPIPGPDKKQSNQEKTKIKDSNKKRKKTGRINRGLTEKSYTEYKAQKRADYNNFMHTKSPDKFNADIIERVEGEIIPDNDLATFKELYQLTCNSILDQFKQDNPELIKKHPYNYFKPLLLEVKKNVQRITADDIEKCFIVWDCLSDLLYSIGLYPTFETFQYMTNIYKYQLENRKSLSSLYIDFLKKVNMESDGALINELAMSPYNSTNKIFLAKVHGIIEKTEPKQIEITHNIQSFSNISKYRLENSENN